VIALLSARPVRGRSVSHFLAWSCLELSVRLQRHAALCGCRSCGEHYRGAIDDAAYAAYAAHEIALPESRRPPC